MNKVVCCYTFCRKRDTLVGYQLLLRLTALNGPIYPSKIL